MYIYMTSVLFSIFLPCRHSKKLVNDVIVETVALINQVLKRHVSPVTLEILTPLLMCFLAPRLPLYLLYRA